MPDVVDGYAQESVDSFVGSFDKKGPITYKPNDKIELFIGEQGRTSVTCLIIRVRPCLVKSELCGKGHPGARYEFIGIG